MTTRSGRRVRTAGLTLLTAGLVLALTVPTAAAKPPTGFLTADSPFITLDPGLPAGASVKAIISSGDEVGSFMFEGTPDGIGIRPGADKHTVDVYVAHEQTTIPFFGSRDFQDASVSRLTLSTKGGPNQGAVSMPTSPLGPKRDSSASAPPRWPAQMRAWTTTSSSPARKPTTRSMESSAASQWCSTPAPGEHTAVPGMGRLNHENTWWSRRLGRRACHADHRRHVLGPSAQLYMYVAADQDAIFDDEGSLYALRITGRRRRSARRSRR